VIHRDVKPANILLDQQGQVGIVDFGIAKALAVKGGTISITGEIIGTPEYMSPEQAAGGGDLDARCDIYSLGVVGYEMLAGRVPFEEASVHDVLASVLHQQASDVRTFRPDAPRDFVAAVHRCLRKPPGERWPTAGEAAAAAAGSS
jgi:serine/threonine-protein kinase